MNFQPLCVFLAIGYSDHGSQSAIRSISHLYVCVCVCVNILVVGGRLGEEGKIRGGHGKGRGLKKTIRKGRQDLFDMNYLMYII